MTFPTTPVSTANLDAATDDPSLARADLKTAVDYINTIISEANTVGGVAVLNGNGALTGSMMPSTINPTGQLTLTSTSQIVKVEDLLRLQYIPVNQLAQFTQMIAGDMCIAQDADAGNPALAIYDGTNWRYMPMASWTIIT